MTVDDKNGVTYIFLKKKLASSKTNKYKKNNYKIYYLGLNVAGIMDDDVDKYVKQKYSKGYTSI